MTVSKKAQNVKTITKGNVWDLQENDVIRLWDNAEKDTELKEYISQYINVLKTAFYVEELETKTENEAKEFTKNGYKIRKVKEKENTIYKWAIKKRQISTITDLTTENIKCVSVAQLIEILGKNFGSGWDALPSKVQDIISISFEISTTTMPKERLAKPGSMYKKKLEDGYEVLIIEKGSWVEVMFIKEKEEIILSFDDDFENDIDDGEGIDTNEDEDDTMNFDKESYRTTFDEDQDNLEGEAEEISDEDE